MICAWHKLITSRQVAKNIMPYRLNLFGSAVTYICNGDCRCRFKDFIRHARAHYYVNVGHGNIGSVIIHEQSWAHYLYKWLSTMLSRRPLQALSVNIAAKVQLVSGGRLPPTGPKTATRCGPKPKPLAQRVFKHCPGPVKRVKRS